MSAASSLVYYVLLCFQIQAALGSVVRRNTLTFNLVSSATTQAESAVAPPALGAAGETGLNGQPVNATQDGVFINNTGAGALPNVVTSTDLQVSTVTQVQGASTITTVVTNTLGQAPPAAPQAELLTLTLGAPPVAAAPQGQAQAPAIIIPNPQAVNCQASTVTVVAVVTPPPQVIIETVTQLLTLTVAAPAAAPPAAPPAASVVLAPAQPPPLLANGTDIALPNGTAPAALGKIGRAHV